MARDNELVSLASFGEDLIASGNFASLSSLDIFAASTDQKARSHLTVAPDVSTTTRAKPISRVSPLAGWTAMSRSTTAHTEINDALIIGGATVKNVSLVVGEALSSGDPATGHEGHDLYSDLKVLPVPVTGVQSGGGSLLVAPIGKTAGQSMLLLPADSDSAITFPQQSKPIALPNVGKEIGATKGEVGAAPVDSYVLSGDIENFFGIKGLKAKLYSFKNEQTKDKDDDKDKPVQEKIKLEDMESPLAILFPEIEQSTIQKLPIKNLEFTYSNTEKDSLFPVGLRLEGDLEFKDGLQFVADGLKNVFGSDKGTTLPSKLRISALIAKERDWSKKPKIDGLVLQAYVDMSLPKWDFLEFKTAGIELSARREEKKDDKKDDKKDGKKVDSTKDDKEGKKESGEPDDVSEPTSLKVAAEDNKSDKEKDEKDKKKEWKLGFGIFGKLNITKLPKSKGTLEARYWIRGGDWKEEKNDKKKDKDGKDSKENKDKKTEKGDKDKKDDSNDAGKKTDKSEKKIEQKDDGSLAKTKDEVVIDVGKWKNFCGVANLDMKKAQLRARFAPGEFKETCTLTVSGSLEFPQGRDKEKDDKEDEEEKPKNATLAIKGQLSRKDYHFDAKVGDLKLESILKIYAHINGVEPKADGIKDHNLTFEELHLNIGRKLKKKKKEEEKQDKSKGDAKKEETKDETKRIEEKAADAKETETLQADGDSPEDKQLDDEAKAENSTTEWAFELSGKVSFNDVKSVHGLIKIDSTGLTIEGGVEDYEIKDAGVTINEARIDIFIGAKPKADKKQRDQGEIKSVENSTTEAGDGTKAIVYNRASKFSIRGKVTFSGVTVTVVFLTERKETNKKSKKASEREWVLYGLADTDLSLEELCDTLKGSSIGKLKLRNIALIAASGKIKTIEELNTMEYPVNKGISLCATIPPLDELNNLAKQTVDGLILCATIQKGLDLKICLPKSMDIHFSETVTLGNIGVGIEISKSPSLSLEGVLTILMESGQDPLVLEGMVRAGLLEASAKIATKQPWVNPFNISKEVTIADFRVEILIEYAKFLEVGPSKLGLGGQIEVGDFHAGADMVISHFPNDQLISVNISKVDLIEIINVAGKVADIPALREMRGAEQTFVFTDAELYISTGATIADKEYPRGISGGGKLTAFGKKAEFELDIGEVGLDFKGAIDNFSLGPLVVSSASGEPRASMVVLMTKDQQVIKVDGMVTCFGIGLVALVDIQLGTETPVFNAYIAVQFTEAFKISLQATTRDFNSVRDLANQGLYFQAQIEGDLFDMICESVKNMIKTLEKMGTEGIEAMQKLIGDKVGEKQAEMEKLAQALEDARKQLEKKRSERQIELEKEEKKRKEAETEISRLRNAVATAKKNKEKAQQELEQKVKQAELEKESLIRQKRKEYSDKLEEAKEEEARNRRELERLKREQANRYGTDFLKRVELAKGAWYEKQAAEAESWKAVQWVYQQKCNANAGRLEAAKAAHEIVKAATDVYHETAKGFDATINSDAFQSLVKGIETAAEAVENAAKGVDNLLQGGGVDGFIRAFVDTENRKIQAAIDNLRALQDENSKYQKAIREAQAKLDANGPNLVADIRAADEAITRIKEDAELAKLQREYNYKLKVHEEVHNTIEQMQAGLEALKEDWQSGMKKLQDVVNEIQKAISSVFHIEKIMVGVHTHALVKDEPLAFKFYGTVAGRKFEVEAEWSPNRAIGDLYKQVTNEILKL
ncbi:uncharacterized protein BP01DRAFT_343380 [Aspergillus saccharolyticus JOP 1030-1]|uniref:Uncharacterized protein n=1 Tax=Aspergillus saccharolyticus JOP 1030-1 TaxID=1450539 RepID=A0A318ZHP5_9EURO|nr:hypothetical protein BP01DRAFT_343380 [Aspergillus saccharolyticus JOP 1030-1]PYH44093.1 hypothetical protein BP01DRAFT_343380 [Aspergillus saccharolyticus JOP 1030-1]